VPITIKDLIYVAGTPANGGAPMLDGFVPDTDSAVVTAVKAAGAIVTCKTTTCESGYKLTADSPVSGITRNPWSLNRTSGGSRWRGGCRRGWLRPARHRHRWGRLDPGAEFVLRRVRA
jgi:amidase